MDAEALAVAEYREAVLDALATGVTLLTLVGLLLVFLLSVHVVRHL